VQVELNYTCCSSNGSQHMHLSHRTASWLLQSSPDGVDSTHSMDNNSCTECGCNNSSTICTCSCFRHPLSLVICTLTGAPPHRLCAATSPTADPRKKLQGATLCAYKLKDSMPCSLMNAAWLPLHVQEQEICSNTRGSLCSQTSLPRYNKPYVNCQHQL
jgi:hypothetical protein